MAQHNPTENLSQYAAYFQSIKAKRRNLSQAQMLESMAEQCISLGIKTGEITVEEGTGSLDTIILESRIKAEEDKIDDYQARKKLIDMQLQYLNSQIQHRRSPESAEDSQLIRNYTAVLSKREHQQFLRKITQEKSELEAKRKKLGEISRQKEEEEERRKRIEEEERSLQQELEKKNKLLEKGKLREEEKEKKYRQIEESNKKFAEIKKKKRLHEVIEEKYTTEVLLPSLEEKKKKLREIREMSRAFNVGEINAHEEEYLRRREESLEGSIARVKHQEWNYQKPDKSERLARILEREKIEQRMKLEENKMKLEEKIRRQQEFVAALKERKPPKIDEKKREEIEKRKQRLHSEEKDKAERPDRIALGINYLEEVKRQRKRTSNSHIQFKVKEERVEEQNQDTKKAITNYLDSRRSKRQYNELREKRIDKLIHSNTTDKHEKIQQLQQEANKLAEQQKRNEERIKLKGKSASFDDDEAESMGLLLASIKAKMGIIDVYNKD